MLVMPAHKALRALLAHKVQLALKANLDQVVIKDQKENVDLPVQLVLKERWVLKVLPALLEKLVPSVPLVLLALPVMERKENEVLLVLLVPPVL